MAAPVPVSSFRSSVGISKEATPGTAAFPTDWIPLFEQPDLQPQQKALLNTSNLGSAVDNTGVVAGVTWTDYTLPNSGVMADAIGYPLAGVLGEVAVTGSGAPFKTTITEFNSGTFQPTSWTLFDNYAAGSRLVPGSKFSEVAFSFTADGLLMWNAKAVGYASITTNFAVPSYSSQPPLAGWLAAVSIAGTTASILKGADWTIKRDVAPDWTAQNQQGPAFVWGGQVHVTGNLNFVMEGDAELNRFLNNTQPAIVMDFTQGASSALVEVKFTMTKCAYTGPPKIDRSGSYPIITMPFTAVGNTTDVGASGGYGPCQVVLQNAKGSSTYS